MRTYELVLVVDPRLSDEDVVALTDDYKRMIAAGGGEVVKEVSWGRRRMAYTIQKLNEAKYVMLGVNVNGHSGKQNPLPEVELRLRQNDKVLRYLTVRVDGNLTETTPAAVPAPGDRDRDRDRDRGDRGDRGDRDRDRDRGARPRADRAVAPPVLEGELSGAPLVESGEE